MVIGNVSKITKLENLAKNLISDEKSLLFNLDDEWHIIKTVLLPAANSNRGKKNISVLWYEKRFVEQFTETRFFLDGTFRIRPALKDLGRASQFLTLMAD